MQTVCELNMCAGCMACIDICPCNAIEVRDDFSHYNAIINEEKCVNCGACHKVCQENTHNTKREPILWKQGWVENEHDRSASSSGGMATAIARAFIMSGGIVCGCVFEKGEFIFKYFDKIDNVEQLAGSKYVKSNPIGIYKEIKRLLLDGNKVLFIGLPCQVAALYNYIGNRLQENVYTIDLICHGSPSPQLLEIFLNQYECSLNKIERIRFRKKNYYQVEKTDRENNVYNPIGSHGGLDSYMIGFLNCLFFTQNCYECKFASRERISDITLGDSWGSKLSEREQKKGISLALCQTNKGKTLLEMASLHLEDVDIPVAIEHNHQLREPAKIPRGRKRFFKGIEARESFNKLIWKCYPIKCFKQEIKKLLLQFHIISRNDDGNTRKDFT